MRSCALVLAASGDPVSKVVDSQAAPRLLHSPLMADGHCRPGVCRVVGEEQLPRALVLSAGPSPRSLCSRLVSLPGTGQLCMQGPWRFSKHRIRLSAQIALLGSVWLMSGGIKRFSLIHFT